MRYRRSRGSSQQGTPPVMGDGGGCAPESLPDWRTGRVSSGRAKGTQISLQLQRRKGRKGKETARTNIFLEGEKPGKVNSDTHTKKENTNPCPLTLAPLVPLSEPAQLKLQLPGEFQSSPDLWQLHKGLLSLSQEISILTQELHSLTCMTAD